MDHGPVEAHLFYGPIKMMPADFSAEDKERLTKAAIDASQTGCGMFAALQGV